MQRPDGDGDVGASVVVVVGGGGVGVATAVVAFVDGMLFPDAAGNVVKFALAIGVDDIVLTAVSVWRVAVTMVASAASVAFASASPWVENDTPPAPPLAAAMLPLPGMKSSKRTPPWSAPSVANSRRASHTTAVPTLKRPSETFVCLRKNGSTRR